MVQTRWHMLDIYILYSQSSSLLTDIHLPWYVNATCNEPWLPRRLTTYIQTNHWYTTVKATSCMKVQCTNEHHTYHMYTITYTTWTSHICIPYVYHHIYNLNILCINTTIAVNVLTTTSHKYVFNLCKSPNQVHNSRLSTIYNWHKHFYNNALN